MDVLMPAGELRLGDVFSIPGVVVRGPFRVLKSARTPDIVKVLVCDPDEETCYPISSGQLQVAPCCTLERALPVLLHDRNRY